MTDPATYEKLTTYCAYAERCTADVKKRLITYKVEKSEHGVYIDRLKEAGFLNDERYIKSYVSAHIKKRWGKVKIKAGLRAKGIAASTIQTYLADVEEDDYQERLLKLVTDKAPRIKGNTLQDRKIKLMRHLLSKGYSSTDINAAIERTGALK